MMYGLTPFARNAFSLLNAFDEFDRDFSSGSLSVSTFRTDIIDNGEKYIMESELPGFKKEDVKIDINGDYITISAERKTEKNDAEENENNYKYIRRERTYGSFTRSFGISDVNADDISASFKDGILTIELPKKKPEEPLKKSLEIK